MSHDPRSAQGILRRLALCLLLTGCGVPAEPGALVVWTWGGGERSEATARLVRDFDRQQEGLRVTCRSWPLAAGGDVSPTAVLRAVEEASGGGRPAPALLEVTETALPALIGAGLAYDVGGRLSRRMGVVWEDYLPWMMPSRLVASEGVPALPFLVEAPMLAFREPDRLGGGGAAGIAEALLTLSTRDAGNPRRPLAAAADHRIFLWILGDEALERGPAGTPLDDDSAGRGLDRLRALLGGRAVGVGAEGQARALDEVQQGRAVAAWVWSSGGNEAVVAGLQLRRAPARPRGTYLVVNARAPWRDREAAFRLARWLTEPEQAAELAVDLGTVPVRASAAAGARYLRVTRGEPWRQEALGAGAGAPLPASLGLAEALVTDVEQAMAAGELDPSLLARLQDVLVSADAVDEGGQ